MRAGAAGGVEWCVAVATRCHATQGTVRDVGGGAQVDRWRVTPGDSFELDSIDAASTSAAPGDKEATRAASTHLNDELSALQERLWAEGRRAVLVILQAMDAGGKDGTIKKVFTGLNPQGVEVTSFKVPTDEELAHDFLWRIHRRTPKRGHIGIFNRSHYEDVLIVRVHGHIDAKECKRRYEQIRDFEELLVAQGTTIVKFMLHISSEEQADRFRSRLQDPEKNWKFNAADLDERKRWPEYVQAYQDALVATSTDAAPWYVIPADKKWYRDWAVLEVLVATLRRMDPQFPAPTEDLSGVTVE